MSDNGVLTRQAQRAMDLANALEARLVQAKHGNALALDLDDDALGRAPMDLPALLDTLVCMVSPDYGLPDPGLATDIPPSLVTKLRAAERGGEMTESIQTQPRPAAVASDARIVATDLVKRYGARVILGTDGHITSGDHLAQ